MEIFIHTRNNKGVNLFGRIEMFRLKTYYHSRSVDERAVELKCPFCLGLHVETV